MGQGGSLLDTFVVPRPNPALIAAMVPLNRWLMLRGTPILRDIPGMNRIPGIRGIANIRHIDFPQPDQQRLAATIGESRAAFITPNHPEFFTDWMIDKEIAARLAPRAAFWATNGVVNGLGRAVQRFWLANNLIAQIPGNSAPARAHSVDWALRGNGVLLHAEGAVGWHADVLAPLMPGAAEMAFEALRLGQANSPDFQAFVVPVVWKLAFMRDVTAALHAECAYVERKLNIGAPPALATPAERVYRIYEALLTRDEAACEISGIPGQSFAQRHDVLVSTLSARLADMLGLANDRELLSDARRWLRKQSVRGEDKERTVRKAIETLQRLKRIGPFAWASPMVTKEQVAEHIKRIRNDYCKGTLRDTLNAFIPQPVGPRTCHIRVAEPLAIHAFKGSAEEATEELRRRMQAALDAVNAELRAAGRFNDTPNPFFVGQGVEAAAVRAGLA